MKPLPASKASEHKSRAGTSERSLRAPAPRAVLSEPPKAGRTRPGLPQSHRRGPPAPANRPAAGPSDASAGQPDPSTAAPGTCQRHRRAAWRSRPVPASASRLGAPPRPGPPPLPVPPLPVPPRPAGGCRRVSRRLPRRAALTCWRGRSYTARASGRLRQGVQPPQRRPGYDDISGRGWGGARGTTPSTGRCMRKPRSRRPRPLSRAGTACARHGPRAPPRGRLVSAPRGERPRRSRPRRGPAGAPTRVLSGAAPVCQRLPANIPGLLPIFCVRPHVSVVAPSEMVPLRPLRSKHQA